MEAFIATPEDGSIPLLAHSRRLRHGSLLWSRTSSGSDTPDAIGQLHPNPFASRCLARERAYTAGEYKTLQPVSETKQPRAIKEVRHDL
jgi:hypothetical protein